MFLSIGKYTVPGRTKKFHRWKKIPVHFACEIFFTGEKFRKFVWIFPAFSFHWELTLLDKNALSTL